MRTASASAMRSSRAPRLCSERTSWKISASLRYGSAEPLETRLIRGSGAGSMGAGSDMPPRTSSDGGGVPLRLCEDPATMHRAVGFGVFSAGGDAPRVGFRVGHGVLDLPAHGLGTVFEAPTLNPFLALGRSSWEDTVARVAELVDADVDLVPLEDAEVRIPFAVADYVDFYSSLEHATNLGRLFRPDSEPLLPNWRQLPVAYHGRAGTGVVSGTPIVRPCGQAKAPADQEPRFGPSARLDIELELGFVAGVGSDLGTPVPASRFRDHVFGVVLVNDWSARDIQGWEYQPLGPFLGKSFSTSIGAWVTPLALLEDRFVPAPPQDP